MKPLYGTEQYMKLNLSENFDIKSDFKINQFVFPGGEPHVKLEPIGFLDAHSPIRIYQTIKTFSDFGMLCAAVSAVRTELGGNGYISVFIPYFPGARQDRIAPDTVETFTVKMYADLVNSLKLDEVIIFDPHSEVAPALINNCIVLDNHKFVNKAILGAGLCVIVSPDAGAAKKTESVVKSFPVKWHKKDGMPDIIYFKKNRDMKTGELSGFQTDKIDLAGYNCVIIDDICDGGGTFLAIAEVLKTMNCGKLHLIVSHGIFSKGLPLLLDVFKTISSTNSFIKSRGDGLFASRVNNIDLIKLYDL
jgi:ribose-phosphate pyrophosphokinase